MGYYNMQKNMNDYFSKLENYIGSYVEHQLPEKPVYFNNQTKEIYVEELGVDTSIDLRDNPKLKEKAREETEEAIKKGFESLPALSFNTLDSFIKEFKQDPIKKGCPGKEKELWQVVKKVKVYEHIFKLLAEKEFDF